MSSVVLLSGGLDSTVAATLARAAGGLAQCLTMDYGQRAADREIAASRAIARALDAPHRVIRLDFLGGLTATALVHRGEALPSLDDDELDDVEGAARASMRRVWVPNRNGLFLGIAAAFAEAMHAAQVVVGFNREEAATFPDNSAAFLDASSAALSLSTLSGVRVASPTLEMDKAQIVAAGYEAGAPMQEIWSCYESGPEHCGACESCRRLLRALDRAGARDRFDRERASGAHGG